MDTVGENFEIKKRVLLRSSPLSRKNEAPLLVNLRMIDTKPSAGYFTHQNLIGGILLEGKFGSVYRNRLIDRSVMPSDWQLRPESKPTSMAVFSDGGLLSNKANKIGNESKIVPLGYDRVSKITFGNRDFFYNLVQYMCDDASLSALRGKAWKLRLLDKVKTNESGNIVKWLNLLLPLAGIALLGGWFTWWRKRRNGRETKRPMLR
jgi:ABC-2 type transport system permease protein